MKAKAKAVSKPHTTESNVHPSPSKANYQQTEESLREYQSILAIAEEVANIGSWKWDLCTQKVTWSDQMFRLFGVEREEFDGDVNHVIAERVHPDDIAAVTEANRLVLEDTNPVPMSYRIVLPDGMERTVWAQGKLIHDEAGNAIALTGYVQDITERVKAEKKIIRLKRLYATLSQVNQMIVRVKEPLELYQTICDVAVEFGAFTLAWVGLLDEDSGEVRPAAANGLDIRQWPFPIVNLHQEEYRNSLISTALRASRVTISENLQTDARMQSFSQRFRDYPYHAAAIIPFQLRNKTLGVLSLISQEMGLFQDEDEIRLLDEMGLDISFALDNMENEKERKRVEQSLRNSEERLRLSLLAANQGLYDLNVQTGNAIVNRQYAEMLGYDPDTFVETNAAWIERLHPDDRERTARVYSDYTQGLLPEYRVEFRQKMKDGKWKWILSLGKVIEYDNEGQPLRMLGTHTDIDKRRQTEEALRQSEERYRQLIESAPTAIAIARNGRYIYVNSKFLAMHRLQHADELIGLEIAETIAPEHRAEFVERAVRRAQGFSAESQYETVGLRKDGTQFPVSASVSFVNMADGPAILGFFEDITERKEAEDAVRSRSRQLEALLTVSRSLTESLNLPEVLQRITDRVTDMSQVETSAIYLVNGESLYLGASTPPLPTGMPEELRQTFVKDHPHIAKALASGQPVTVPDARLASMTTAEQHVRDNLNLRTVVYIPVTTKQDAVGVLILGSVGEPKEFSKNEISLANAVSNQAALAITNAKLYEDVAQQVQELEEQISERKKAEEALKQSEHVLRLFVEHSPASIAMFDRDMKYIVASQRYLMDYDLPQQNLAGLSHYDVFPELPESWREIHRRCLTGAIEKAEDPFPRSNGKVDWVRWEIRPWYEEPEKIGGIILFSEVVTERKQIQDELRQLNAELEQRVLQRTMELSQANRAKDEFLANMSHELRTPLNTVLGLSESLLEQRRGPLNEKQIQSIELIFSSGQHLLGLINDILEVSKIEAGKLQLNPSLISLKDLCESSLNFIKELALKKQIAVEFNNETSIARFQADSQRLKQILINLLNNAVKFTPEKGRVSLHVSTNIEEDRIFFSVIDTGIGIAAEDLKKLFTPFTQLDSSLSRQYAGTGLGLALVQKLTELHGGSIEVESKVGRGSRFTIILPLNESAQEQIIENPVDVATGEQNPALSVTTPTELGTILLAEDNMINADMLSEYLTAHGYYVVTAGNGEEVLIKATRFKPDLILMDIQMPKMDGLEATRHLRSNPGFISTPIIALTALAMPGDKEHCFEAGVNEYMSKPVRLKTLLRVIEKLINSKS